MKVKLLSFGITKDILGHREQTYTIHQDQMSVGELKTQLQKEYPELLKLNSLSIAYDEEYVNDSHIIKENATIALIPPVSGG